MFRQGAMNFEGLYFIKLIGTMFNKDFQFTFQFGKLILQIVLLFGQNVAGVDEGFEMFFMSQRATYHDIKVNFTNPLPGWLKGTYIRNGLGQYEMGKRKFTHAFDGFAKLCSWRFIGNGDVQFSSKFLETNFYHASKAKDNIAPYLLFESTQPPFSTWEKMQALWHGIDNTNTNIHRFNRQQPDENGWTSDFVAVSDFWQMYTFNASTLRTEQRIDAEVPGGAPFGPFGSRPPLPSSSHPIQEYGTKNLISYVSIMNPLPLGRSSIRIVRIISTTVRKLIKEIKVDQVPYMHSFGLSKNYALIFAAPLYVNIERLMQNAEPVNSLDWFPSKPMVVYVVNIHNGDTVALETEAVFPMHNINAFENENGLIIADAVTYPDLQFMKALEMNVLTNKTARDMIPSNSLLKRFTIDLKRKTIRQMPFPFTPSYEFVNYMDMPNINENYRHRSYCYIYGLVLKSDGLHLSNATIVKKNLCKPGCDTAWYRLNHYPTEPWFVPKPGGEDEDDGILLSLILDGERKTSYLAMFDAKTMKLINKNYLQKHIPFTLHGKFFPDL